LWRSFSYNVHTYLLRRKELVSDVPWLGVRLRTGAEDMLGRRLFKRGTYEVGVTDFMMRYLSLAPQDVIFDVGANVGYYSVLAHRVLGDSVSIHAIEAEPYNFDLLQTNLRTAAADSVVAHFVAASDREGEAELYLWKSSNRGKHSLVPYKGVETLTVKIRTLDSIYREQGLRQRTVSLLKIDIEGAEHQAFLGASEMLQRCSVIVAEVSPAFLRRAGVSIDEHVALVLDEGFSMFEIHGDARVTPCSADDLRHSPSGRNVAYLRTELEHESWVPEVFGTAR
jgi:FkbM family methyltransferase